jgi:hypothetical protein
MLIVRNNSRQLRELQEVKSVSKSLALTDVSPYSREYDKRMAALRAQQNTNNITGGFGTTNANTNSNGSMSARRPSVRSRY